MTKHKILYCASTAGHLMQFHLPYLEALHNQGHHIIVCVDEEELFPYVDAVTVVPFQKQIISTENMKNIVRMHRLLKRERFDAVSVHTTLAAVIVRVSVMLLPKKQRPKVIYICHGYLFGQNDDIDKWLYLLPERFCAHVTDVLMVMNREDWELARQYRLCNQEHGHMRMIPGMGVNFKRFDNVENKAELRKQYDISEDAVIYIFAGEFSRRKNQQMLIQAFARAVQQMPNGILILAGEGRQIAACRQYVQEHNLQDRIMFPGYVTNLQEWYRMADICVSASNSEGLPFNIMEAMYCSLPCIVSDVKGHRDLIRHKQNGCLFTSELQLVMQMVQLYQDAELRDKLGKQAAKDVLRYDLSAVQPIIMKVYEENL